MADVGKISCEFAILDIKKGRRSLYSHFEKMPLIGEVPTEFHIPVTLTGYIIGAWGNDDGESREFSMAVENISVGGGKP